MTSDVESAAERRAREKRARSFIWQTLQRIKRRRYERSRARWAKLHGLPYGPLGRGSKGQ